MDKVRQFIKDCTRGCSNELCAVEDRYGKKVISYHEWLTPEQALAAVEIARKELIERACEWLSNVSIEDMIYKYDDFSTSEKWYEFINDFKKAMEDRK